jgi:hypothetical protein
MHGPVFFCIGMIKLTSTIHYSVNLRHVHLNLQYMILILATMSWMAFNNTPALSRQNYIQCTLSVADLEQGERSVDPFSFLPEFHEPN